MPKIPKSMPLFDTYLGIDPGGQGGFAIIKGNKVIAIYEMPNTPLDLSNVFKGIQKEHNPTHTFIEQVQSMPGEGHKGAFTFGRGVGRLEQVLADHSFSYEFIRPQAWQKQLNIPSRGKDEAKPAFKERLRKKAQELFPKLSLWSELRTLGKQRAVCDAILLGECCRRSQEFHKG